VRIALDRSEEPDASAHAAPLPSTDAAE
jgi:hypothetical protein